MWIHSADGRIHIKLLHHTLTCLLVGAVLAESTQFDCGIPLRRHFRHPRSEESVRIIKGRESKRGAWPWQVSLQLLHPKYGFIGHWCGGVLIHPTWIVTAAHCINNELFNLPVAALWTAVLGEWDRSEQSGFYIPIEKVILHHRYHHYQHDIAMMKLSKAANIHRGSKVKSICLPEPNSQNIFNQKATVKPSEFYYQIRQNPLKTTTKRPNKQNSNSVLKYLEKLSNMTRAVLSNMLSNKSKSLKYNIRVDTSDQYGKKNERVASGSDDEDESDNRKNRPNAKKLHFGGEDLYSPHGDDEEFTIGNDNSLDDTKDCYVTGWGRSQTNGSLTDKLLEASVPPLPLEQCMGKYPENLPLRAGHLCAGNTDGSSGTCVGDSGGPLQCQTSDGRWQLLGITSFGSGCARPGIPDVYTYVPHYVNWIKNTMKNS